MVIFYRSHPAMRAIIVIFGFALAAPPLFLCLALLGLDDEKAGTIAGAFMLVPILWGMITLAVLDRRARGVRFTAAVPVGPITGALSQS